MIMIDVRYTRAGELKMKLQSTLTAEGRKNGTRRVARVYDDVVKGIEYEIFGPIR